VAEQTSLVDLGRSLVDEARGLIRKEIELAKVEVIDLLKTNAIAVGMFAGAAIVAFMFLILVQVAIIVTVPNGIWVAWGLVVLWLVVIIVLALVGRSKLKLQAPEKTVETIKGDIEWAKGQIRSNGR